MVTTKVYKLILYLTLIVALFVPNPAYAESESENSYQRGNDYFDKHQYGMAITNYTQAIELNPQYVKAYLNRGLAYRYKSRDDLALADYTKAIEINPQYTDSYDSRGGLYHRYGKFDLAIADYTKAIEINPQSTEYYIKRAEVYRWTSNELAVDEYNQVLKMDPNNEAAYNGKYTALKYGSNYSNDVSNIRDTSYNPFRPLYK